MHRQLPKGSNSAALSALVTAEVQHKIIMPDAKQDT